VKDYKEKGKKIKKTKVDDGVKYEEKMQKKHFKKPKKKMK